VRAERIYEKDAIRSDEVSKGPIRVEKESAKSDSEESKFVRMMPVR
jgi:hypothetical protein